VASTEGGKKEGLAEGEEITQQILCPPKSQGPSLPSSEIGFQRACLVTFQTWSIRAPGIVGLLLGCSLKNKREACHSVVVDRSLATLLSDPRIDFVCKQEQLNILGLIQAGCVGEDAIMKEAQQNMERLQEKVPGASAMVLVPQLLYNGGSWDSGLGQVGTLGGHSKCGVQK